MKKRYQVFISSTFQDLENARQEVSQALLRADCFPAGMELFPAADEEQFEFIKKVIDQSDYYIIISAGRYGSIHPETSLSYTEMEYNYALETRKPVIRLLHKDPESLPNDQRESSNNKKSKLYAFREKMGRSSLVRFWRDPPELSAEVVFGLMDARQRFPAIGWVPADGKASEELELENFRLKDQIKKLEDAQDSKPILETLEDVPAIFRACVEKEVVNSSIETVFEILAALAALFASGLKERFEVLELLGFHGVSEPIQEYFLDALVADGMVAEVEESHFLLTQLGQDTVRKARLRSFLIR